TYRYFGRGAATNDVEHSAEAGAPKPLHSPGSEFRGFAWVQEQSPIQQSAPTPIYQSVEHYYSQDDSFKAKEWRTEVGKGITLSYGMEDTFPLPAPAAALWTTAGTISRNDDPLAPGNGVWNPWEGASITRNAGVSDGSEVSVRFMIKDGGVDPSTMQYQGTFKLERTANSDDYWGVKIYTRGNQQRPGAYELFPKVVWK